MKINIKYLLLLTLIILYFITRFYRLEELYTFSFDQYRDAWEVKKIIIDRKFTLIGPQSSFYGVFYGPGFYYSLTPFYWLTKLMPLGGALAAIFFGLTTFILLFYTAQKFFSSNVALFASFIYIFSLEINLLNRQCRNDPPLMSFSLILILLIGNILKNPKNKFLLFASGLVAGLGLHFHFAAIVFLPIIIVFLIFQNGFVWLKKIIGNIFYILLGFLVPLLPLIIFNFKHQFMISQNLINLFKQISQTNTLNVTEKIYLNAYLVLKNFWLIIIPLSSSFFVCFLLTTLFLLFIIMAFIKIRKEKKIFKLLIIWLLLPIIFFSFYPEASRNYYFLLNFPIFILILAFGLDIFWQRKKLKYAVFLFLFLMIISNLEKLSKAKNPRSVKLINEMIKFIKNDSQNKPIFIDYFSKDNFKVGFEYLVYAYQLPLVEKQDSNQYSSYLIYTPATKIKSINYQRVFGDTGIVVIPKKLND